MDAAASGTATVTARSLNSVFHFDDVCQTLTWTSWMLYTVSFHRPAYLDWGAALRRVSYGCSAVIAFMPYEIHLLRRCDCCARCWASRCSCRHWDCCYRCRSGRLGCSSGSLGCLQQRQAVPAPLRVGVSLTERRPKALQRLLVQRLRQAVLALAEIEGGQIHDGQQCVGVSYSQRRTVPIQRLPVQSLGCEVVAHPLVHGSQVHGGS
mmetsp:Transcript_43184/g.111934  ORF Transcript_43184/g.111934 Transcript_43184/m.111934 type:complete len:208 (-) Transcript_43184:62-685(-)